MVSVSRGVLALTGYSADEFISGGRSRRELIHPDDRAHLRSTIQTALESRERFVATYRITRADGSERWVEEHGCGVFAPDGRALMLDIHDIPDRMRARQEADLLQALARAFGESENVRHETPPPAHDTAGRPAAELERRIAIRLEAQANLRPQAAALHAAAHAIMITDHGGRIEWGNPAWCSMTGYDSGEVVGKTPRVLRSQHDGAIAAFSEPGKGSTFDVFLPLDTCSTPAATPAKQPAPLAGVGKTILVVEDEPALRRLTARVLQKHGYRVHLAADGGDALRLVADEHLQFDLLLTDVMMPGGLTGPELADRICGGSGELKVVFMSGYLGDGSAGSVTMKEGFNFLQKPFTPDALLDCLQARLGGPGMA